jgi:hypothetical protein
MPVTMEVIMPVTSAHKYISKTSMFWLLSYKVEYLNCSIWFMKNVTITYAEKDNIME